MRSQIEKLLLVYHFEELEKRSYEYESATAYRYGFDATFADQVVNLCSSQACGLTCLGYRASEALRKGNTGVHGNHQVGYTD